MRFRVEETIFDFEYLDEAEQDRLMASWHKSVAVECLCHGERHILNPLLYVKQVNDGLFFANYPSNAKNNVRHDYKCRYNRQGYRSLLQDKGVQVIDDEIRVNLDMDPSRPKSEKAAGPASAKLTDIKPRGKSEPTDRKVQLTTLFFTMLQEFKVTEFRPGGKRNIASRLYKIAKIIKVNGMPLFDMLYVADNKANWPKRDKHQFIIGWGRRSMPAIAHPTNPKFVRLPISSVDDPERLVTELTVLRSIYEQCTNPVPDVDSGYYVLFRGPTKKGDTNIWDRQLCFIPAEEQRTRIPVDSSAEAGLIQYLAEGRRHFERPLIGNVTELFSEQRIDIILHDTEPKTIIALDEGGSILQKKQDGYVGKGFQFIAWDGKDSFPL
ncbi:hypothetical protein [Cohnella soli]|uniref:Uncharacterized protein n=1 Tax=Cohnella soli TaxID=425005 RepID=A0ABW0HQP2_9BACL